MLFLYTYVKLAPCGVWDTEAFNETSALINTSGEADKSNVGGSAAKQLVCVLDKVLVYPAVSVLGSFIEFT